jgi:hypothetical protein
MATTTLRAERLARPPARRPDPAPRARTVAARATWLVAVLALAASLAGLLIDDIYIGAASTAEMFRAYDLVTAALVSPALTVAARMARTGSPRASLCTAGLLAYLAYTYAYYLFGTGYNDLFLLHVAVFTAAVLALVLTLAALDVGAVATALAPGPRVRVVAGILGILAAALAGMWTYFTVDNAVTGEVPAGSRLVETATIVHLGMALDLTVLVPLYAAAALLMWRHAAWGYVLAAVALVAGVLHQVSYMVAMPFQVAADIPGAASSDPAEPLIVLLYLVGAFSLLRGSARVLGRR